MLEKIANKPLLLSIAVIVVFFMITPLLGDIVLIEEISEGKTLTLEKLIERMYYSAGVLVALIALAAAYFTFSQFKSAENSRKALLLIEVSKRFESPEVVYSFSRLRGWSKQWSHDENLYKNSELKSKEDFFHKNLLNLHNHSSMPGNTDNNQNSEYLKCLKVMDFFEDIGVLTRKNYASLDDVFEIYRTPIITTGEYLSKHIDYIRSQNSDTTYANALWLFDQAEKYTPNAYAHKRQKRP